MAGATAPWVGRYYARSVLPVEIWEPPRVGQVKHGILVAAVAAVGGSLLVVGDGSVVDFEGDAIVNAANVGMLGGGGVDGAITRAGGPVLAEAREALPVVNAAGHRCLTGDAKITVGGELKARWCIHAVGPNYHVFADPAQADEALAHAYGQAVELAVQASCRNMAFSLLSAGIFRGSCTLHHVLQTGVSVIARRFRGRRSRLREIWLVGFTSAEIETLTDLVMNVGV